MANIWGRVRTVRFPRRILGEIIFLHRRDLSWSPLAHIAEPGTCFRFFIPYAADRTSRRAGLQGVTQGHRPETAIARKYTLGGWGCCRSTKFSACFSECCSAPSAHDAGKVTGVFRPFWINPIEALRRYSRSSRTGVALKAGVRERGSTSVPTSTLASG